MSNFTDQKPRVATKKDVLRDWGGGKRGKRFRCYLCGYKFKVGDVWRWVYGMPRTMNIFVCNNCDEGDVIGKFKEICQKYAWIWCRGANE